MGATASCCNKNAPKDINEIEMGKENAAVNMESTEEKENERIKSYHSSDSEDVMYHEEEEMMKGVSNVVYRKGYFQSEYSVTSCQLGSGSTGTIRTVINRKTGEQFALKTIDMMGLDERKKERLIQEVLILGRLHHQNIVKLYEVYETPNAMYLIMELLSGGELYTKLVSSPNGKFSEEYAKSIIRQVVNAMYYLHEVKNIAHRDLKLANIMFADSSPESEVKLIDFGLSKFAKDSEYMHSFVGTKYYMAPEVLQTGYKGMGYNKSCDIWSIGIISYFLLTGHNPLPQQVADCPIEEIKIDHIPFPKRYWSSISEEGQDFVSRLLCIDPVKRMNIEDAQNHRWFKSLSPAPSLDSTTPVSILPSLQAFQGYNLLKKAALTAVAYHLNSNDLMRLGDAFEYFDKQKNGYITFEEFRDAMMTLRSKETIQTNQDLFLITTDESKLRQLFRDIDFEGCGTVNYSEFVAACIARKEGLRRDYAELIFQLIDRDHLGFIEIEDLHLFFGDEIGINEIEAYIIQTFGTMKSQLTETDLEMIMNTKMIMNNHTEDLVTQYTIKDQAYKPDESIIGITSVFSRCASFSSEHLNSTDPATSVESVHSEINEEDVIHRSVLLTAADELASKSYNSIRSDRNHAEV